MAVGPGIRGRHRRTGLLPGRPRRSSPSTALEAARPARRGRVLCFIVPGLLVILVLSRSSSRRAPRSWCSPAAGAGAACQRWRSTRRPASCRPSRRRAGTPAGGAGCATWSPGQRRRPRSGPGSLRSSALCVTEALRRPTRRPHWSALALPLWIGAAPAACSPSAGWRSSGCTVVRGRFRHHPAMQHDTVTHHWMTSSQFLGASPSASSPRDRGADRGRGRLRRCGGGGCGAGGGRGLRPSYGFILLGAHIFAALRASSTVQGFLCRAGPAAIGGIAGACHPPGACPRPLLAARCWAVAAAWLLLMRRGVVSALGGRLPSRLAALPGCQ